MQNKTRNNTLPSPVVHTKQSRNNTLPSPVVHAKNSHATTRCLHRWNTQIVTQRYVALTSSHATTACCPHQWYSQKQRQNNRSPSPAEYNNSHATTRCLHWWNTTVTSTQLLKPAVRRTKRHAKTNSLD